MTKSKVDNVYPESSSSANESIDVKNQDLRFLINSHTGLGNFILKTPMVMAILKFYPNAIIDVIGGGVDRAELALEGADFIDNIYSFDRRWSLYRKFWFYLKLRKLSYDAVFVPFDDETRFMFFGALFCGAKKVYSHVFLKSKVSAFLKMLISVFSSKLTLVPLLPSRHEIDLNYDLLQSFIGRPFTRDYKTYCSFGESSDILDTFGLVKGEYIVIQPGARSGMPTPKRWSLNNFKELIALCHEKYPSFTIVTIGNQYDFDNYVSKIVESYTQVINTAGLTSISEAASILRNAAVSVVHDSGAMHIGGAVKAKMIALYGPTDYTRTKPLGEENTVLFSMKKSFAEMYNFSCGEDLLIEKYGQDYCMDGITPNDVMNAIKKYVSQKAC